MGFSVQQVEKLLCLAMFTNLFIAILCYLDFPKYFIYYIFVLGMLLVGSNYFSWKPSFKLSGTTTIVCYVFIQLTFVVSAIYILIKGTLSVSLSGALVILLIIWGLQDVLAGILFMKRRS